ncbi:MAG: D-alpha,beta-D-heptose 1,7-bisphosphate phosphatase [Verrucomicrobiales bacterium]|nr:D-alpha,beta-D-heptose 1,7-bisphosphate phosphatase [Verrucomicrobiales bacterium]
MPGKRAIFLDRDGTIIFEKDYLKRPEDVVLLPGVGKALRRLVDAGFLLIVVSNQSGVGRGYFTMADVEAVNGRLLELLSADGVAFAHIYIAPEAPGQPSRGRKPLPTFLFDARDELGIDLAQSFMIGDKDIDLQCGWNAAVKKSILVRTGYGKQMEAAGKAGEGIVVDDLIAAADWILKNAA